jgi:hypothetical protein
MWWGGLAVFLASILYLVAQVYWRSHQSIQDRAELHAQVDRNSEAIEDAVAGHESINARLDRIERSLAEVHRVVVGEGK